MRRPAGGDVRDRRAARQAVEVDLRPTRRRSSAGRRRATCRRFDRAQKGELLVARDINLAARSLGASVLAANDESFGEKENLIIDAPADFTPGGYGHKGEIVDGWETRRRGPGRD